MYFAPRRSFLLLFDTDDRKKSRLSALSEGSGWFTGSEWYKHKEERHMKRLTVMIALMLTTLTIASCGGKQTAAEPATEAATSTAGEAAAETANEAEAKQRRRMKRRPMTRYRHRRWRSRTVITQRSSRRTAACSMSMKRRTEKASLL